MQKNMLWTIAILGGLLLSACGADGKFSSVYSSATFQNCQGCHAPGAPGFQAGTEATQNWSTPESAYTSLQGKASGLTGNFEACNGVAFLGSTPETSLIMAALDGTVRASFSSGECNADTISDMTLKIGGAVPEADLVLLREWIAAGAPND